MKHLLMLHLTGENDRSPSAGRIPRPAPVVLNGGDLHGAVVKDPEQDMVRKSFEIRSSESALSEHIRIRMIGDPLYAGLQLGGKAIGDFLARLSLIPLDDLENLDAGLDVEKNPRHLRRSLKNPKNSSCERTLDASSSISRSRRRASSSSSSSIKSGDSDAINRSASLALSFSGRLNASFSASAITLIVSILSYVALVFHRKPIKPHLGTFTGSAGLFGNVVGEPGSFFINSAIARSSCGSRPARTERGSFSTSMSGSTP